MKAGAICLFYLLVLGLTYTATAQVYTRRIAAGNSSDFNKAGATGTSGSIPRRTLKAVDTQALILEDEQRSKLGLPDRMGVDIEIQADFMQIAEKTIQGDQQISRFQFDVPSAQGLSIMFDTLALVNGAQLYIYNADQTVLIGPVTDKQNGRNYWSDLVPGESLIVELKEPLAVAGQSIVQVAKLVQFYRFVSRFGYGTSASCELNIVCYPGYQNEADGVAMLLTNYSPYTYACTGSVLNNTRQDFRSFLLTAFHCFDFSGDGTIQTAERSAASTTQVRFHWESPTCSPTSVDNVYLTLTGTTLQAAYVSSDFSLLEINQQVPPSENITYLGWDRNNSNFSSVFGIHHPSADVKKISFSNNATTFVGTVISSGGNYYTVAGSTHLNVTWNASPNTLGVTEGGSSGSALFNPDRRVVGQLHGGGSYCTSPTSPDQYGRIYTSWTGGGTADTRLSDWLNPTGSTSLTVNSVKTQLAGPSAFTSTASFSLNTGSSSITSWSVSGAGGVIAPASGTGNVANLTASGTVTGATITFWVSAGQTYPISFSKTFNAAFTENFPPIAATIPAQVATVGTPYSYTTPAFTDPEGLPLTYSSGTLPPGLSFNPSTRVINGTPTTSGTFVCSITARDQGGLETSVAFLFTVNCPTVTINASALTVCQGQSVSLTASGATTYLWSTGATTASINPTQSGTYSVTGTTNGCSGTASVNVTVQVPPTVTINASALTVCQGQSVSLTASGATTYLWSTGANTASINPTQSGTYSVTGTTNGCSGTASRTITVQVPPTVTINASALTVCQGQSVSLTASGATTYLWSTGANTASINPTQSGTYSVTGTTSGCSATASVNVTVQVPPTVTINASALTVCQGQSVSLTASGATTYLWSTGATTASINPTQSGTYSVTGTSNGCSGTASRTITVQALPTVTINASTLTVCQGQSVSLTASGATTYLWSTGANTASINPTQSGTYSVTGTTSGCSATASVNVTVQVPPAVTINASTLTVCQGQSVSLTASGATTYLWSTGAATASINPTQSGTYSVTGTSNGCSATASVNVTVQVPPTVTINASTLTVCQGQSVSLTASGATTYLWSTGATTASINPTQSGTYSVTGTSNGCSGTASRTITVLQSLSVTINASALTVCQGQSVSLTASGATTYLWSTGANTASINPAQSGIYSVTGTTNGCSGIASVNVTVQIPPTVTINASALTVCQGQSVSLTASGATTYLWSTGATTASINPTQSGTYSVTGTTNGCSGTASRTITVLQSLSVTINASALTVCQGQSVSLTASGATTYLWSTGANTASINPTQTGIYSVTGTTSGCSATASVNVTVQVPPTVTINASALTVCQGQSVSLTASGATTYLWSTGAATASINPTQSGTYSVTGTSNGCSGTASRTITVLQSLSVTINASALTVCQGQSVSLTASGATTYLWSTGANTASINPTQTGTYSVTGTSNGCSGTASRTITVLQSLSVTINASALTVCQGQSVSLTASGATTYLWSTGANTASINPTQSGTYSVTGTTNGCSGTASVNVTVQALPTITINASTLTVCQGQSVSLTASGATTYLWSTGANTASINPTQSGTYSVTGTTSGCSATASVNVTVQVPPTVTINASALTVCQGQSVSLTASGATTYLWSTGAATASINPTQSGIYSVTGTTNGCSGTASRTITVLQSLSVTINASALTVCQGQSVSLTASGATTYLWSTGAATASINPTQSGTYSVTGTTNGCSGTASVNVTVQALPTVTINASALTVCQGQSVSLTASGATTYLWSTGANTAGINPTQTGTYSVTGTTNGCSGIASVNVTVQVPPTVTINASPLTVCQGQSVSLTASGATTYLWSTGANTASINPTQSGTYSVTGTTNGCPGTASVNVTVQVPPTVTINASTLTVCQGQSASLTASGATTYLWSTGANTASINPTQSGTYSVTGTTNGCSGTASRTITVLQSLSVTINASTLTVCQGQSVSLTASGATTYLWSTGANTASINPTQSGTYSVTGTTNGCSGTASVNVTVQVPPTVTINASALTVCQEQSVSLTASGATTYLWSTGANTASINPTQSGTYSVTGTTSGCSATASVNVTVQVPPTVTINASTLTVCQGQSVSLTASGATIYLWSTGANTASINPTQSGTYSVTGTTSGCSATASVNVTVQIPPTVTINASALTVCQGQSVSLTASGATTYLWSTGANTAGINPTQSGTYAVTGTTSGCSGTASVNVTVQACLLTLSAVITNCEPGELSLQFMASGGNGSAYQFAGVGVTSWTNQTGPFTVSIYHDTAPLELWVRNVNNPAYTVKYTLPIPACARPLPVTITPPVTDTGSAPLQITGASIQCSSRVITLTTTGGSSAPILQRILFVTNFIPVSQDLILDYEVFAERKPVQLQVQQQGVASPLFTFDYSAQCQSVTVTPPVTPTVVIPQQPCASPAGTLGQPLTLSATLVCQEAGGTLFFFPRGGQDQPNTVFEFMSIGVTGWTTSCSVSVSDAGPQLLMFVRQRNPVTNQILGQAMYTLTNPCTAGAGREAVTDAGFTVTLSGNPTLARYAELTLSGQEGLPVWITVTDLQGRAVSHQQAEVTRAGRRYQPELGAAPGVYLLTVRSIHKQQTFRIIRQ